jgi:hypothetical protein
LRACRRIVCRCLLAKGSSSRTRGRSW